MKHLETIKKALPEMSDKLEPTVVLQKRTKVNGEIIYDIIVNGATDSCFVDYERAKEHYDKLVSGKKDTVEILFTSK